MHVMQESVGTENVLGISAAVVWCLLQGKDYPCMAPVVPSLPHTNTYDSMKVPNS